MKHDDQADRPSQFKSTLFLLLFGLTILAFLIQIDHKSWFTLKPASGTAQAMANAASPPAQARMSARGTD